MKRNHTNKHRSPVLTTGTALTTTTVDNNDSTTRRRRRRTRTATTREWDELAIHQYQTTNHTSTRRHFTASTHHHHRFGWTTSTTAYFSMESRILICQNWFLYPLGLPTYILPLGNGGETRAKRLVDKLAHKLRIFTETAWATGSMNWRAICS